MSDRLIPARDLNFDATGRPVHCGQPMEDDVDMQFCRECNGYVRTSDSMAVRAARTGIQPTW